MADSASTRLSFSGHETFPCRYTWPVKGVRGVVQDSGIFKRDDALVTLGVGRNMVKAIRHWCLAFGLITRSDEGEAEMVPTDLGYRLFSAQGWDPYFEHPPTLWLLHWQLVRQPFPASTWHLVFTYFSPARFDRPMLVEWLSSHARASRCRATEASLRRDVEVFLRTYVPSRNSRDLVTEEGWDSPLVELGLIREVEHNQYELARSSQPALPDEIFAYALLDYWSQHGHGRVAVPFDELAYGAGSPGMGFRLTETSMIERLERLPQELGLSYDESSGMRMLRGNPILSSASLMKALEACYGSGQRR